ncbi:MAG: hypothetical protein QOD26_934 [Betaproteobacteria bacterium]|jgi:hypothetical protein|nr:hypothetical protein [Betaproteobacteria bacterium]
MGGRERQIRLRAGATLRIEDGAGLVVEISKGVAWLTQDRDPRDYVLRAGDWLRLDRSEPVVVAALHDDACVTLTQLLPQTA